MRKKKSYIQCPSCLDIIISTYRHDFRHCFCRDCFIDGGDDYTRTGWDPAVSSPKIEFGLFEIDYRTGQYSLIRREKQRDIS